MKKQRPSSKKASKTKNFSQESKRELIYGKQSGKIPVNVHLIRPTKSFALFTSELLVQPMFIKAN